MPNNITKGNKIGIAGFAGRVAKQQASAVLEQTVINAPNRIGLVLDNSGSMNGQKIETLKNAVQGFVNSCDFSNTALALYSIPVDKSNTVGMTQQSALVILSSLQLDANGGGTPLGESMGEILQNESLTRCVIVSDGEATDGGAWRQQAQNFKSAGIPCDCVHIGDDRGGEETLKMIAEITGGIYLKFQDIHQFAKAMHYLTPTYRAMLTSPETTKKLTGADNVR